MLAIEQSFINSIDGLDMQGLKDLCIYLFRENRELIIRQSANEKINTESFILYQQIKKENEELTKERDNLKALLEKEIEKNSLNVRSTFGRKTEGLLAMIASADDKPVEPEDEAQVEDCDQGQNKTRNKIVDFTEIKNDRDSKKSTASDKEKNKGKSGKNGKKNRLKESMANLPREVLYAVDVEALNALYGEFNWRIAHWHEHKTLEKIDNPFYLKVTLTPVISVGLEHQIFSEPYENLLIDRSVVSPSIMSDILYRKFMLSLPWNRQAIDYQMQGIELTKQTIINWAAKVIPDCMNPVVEYLTECLVKYKYQHSDETYIQVNKDDRGPDIKALCGFMPAVNTRIVTQSLFSVMRGPETLTTSGIFTKNLWAIYPVMHMSHTRFWKKKVTET